MSYPTKGIYMWLSPRGAVTAYIWPCNFPQSIDFYQSDFGTLQIKNSDVKLDATDVLIDPMWIYPNTSTTTKGLYDRPGRIISVDSGTVSNFIYWNSASMGTTNSIKIPFIYSGTITT